MILKIAWRNIWRNPTRSMVVITAMFVGMLFGLFSSTFMTGWMQQRLNDGIETETSHIQMHHPQFKNADDQNTYINQVGQKRQQILAISGVNGVSERFKIQAMVASAETSTGIMILGVNPRQEKQVINLPEKIVAGDWFKSKKRNSIVIGQKLAEKLKVRLRSKIVLRLQDADGNITGGAFRVIGIFKTINTSFDEANVWVQKNDLQKLTLLPADAAHEIVVHVENQEMLIQTVNEISTLYPDVLTESWQDVSPELGYLTEVGNTYQYFLVIIILLALGFGIVNTMLMVVLERVRELGMLMAVGMNKRRIFAMIVLESIMLSIVGGFSGILGGIGLTEYLQIDGIDLSLWGEGLTEWGFAPIVFPIYDVPMIITIAALVIITGIIASLYPAYKGLKLNPSEAIRVI
ncbi:MAG: ABC transporter permease [Marinilabiliaceae bacterium]|nr:ABC transporter permease [Marinilabiliaceae bacterium]